MNIILSHTNTHIHFVDEKNIFIDSSFSITILPLLNQYKTLVIIDKDKFTLIYIKEVIFHSNTISIKNMVTDKLTKDWTNILFQTSDFLVWEDCFITKLKYLDRSFSLPPIIFTFEYTREGITILYENPLNNEQRSLFVESLVFQEFEDEISDYVNNVDFQATFYDETQLNKSIKEVNKILKKFLKKLKIPFEKWLFYQRIHIYYKNHFFPFPLQLLRPSFVTYFLYEKKVITDNDNNVKASLFYDPKLNFANKEIKYIQNLLNRNKFHFDTSVIEDIKKEKTRGITFHFSGHGYLSNGQGVIKINNLERKKILYPDAHYTLCFFNCCSVGKTADGIIQNTLKNNSLYVIASIYALTDISFVHSHPFYRFFNPHEIEKSFAFTSILSDYFTYYYSLYSSYSDISKD